MICQSVAAVILAAIAIIGYTTPASARHSFPYQTTIHCGEISTAILTLGPSNGDLGAAACIAGRDAIPAFTSVSGYEEYYKVDGGPSCDENCLRSTYVSMKRVGLMRPLISGDQVTVLGTLRDPDDRRYTICRVVAKGHRLLVLCDALADQPAGTEGSI